VAANLLQAIAAADKAAAGNNPAGSSSGQDPARSFPESAGGRVAARNDESVKTDDAFHQTSTNTSTANSPAIPIAPNANQHVVSDPAGVTAVSSTQSPSTHASMQNSLAAAQPVTSDSKATNVSTDQSAQSPMVARAWAHPLGDVAQASQLYQGVGRAEMHVAIDTEALGPVDLRAAFHQGSLSATIGVQRADVQTLLVSQLPALEHSLGEKQLQVAQISVLAGSVGDGGSNHARDQRGREVPFTRSGQIMSDERHEFRVLPGSDDTAVPAGYSTRLSVIA
jgi:flagellar hook-length control protein FliK